MLIHILKSSTCLAFFLLFYQIFLERENIHVFKRWYLLTAIMLALGIPFITFTQYVEAPVQIFPSLGPYEDQLSAIPPEEIATNYWPVLLWSIYGLGVMVFGFKFVKNLWNILHNIRTNPKLKINTLIHVLLQKAVIPHTFFRYIFLNKQQFEANQIPKEVVVHEATHAKQWHSLDVLFIELLHVLLWFNPLVLWAKYHIRLNHEFLADQAVLKSNIDRALYQKTLLSFTETYHQSLANAILYSSHSSINLTLFGKSFTIGRNSAGQVKKRFKVMKTHNSKKTKKTVLIRSLFLLPLLALLIYGFSNRENMYQKGTTEMQAYTNLIGECGDMEHHAIRLNENKLHMNGRKFDNSMAWLSFLRTKYGGSSEEGLPKMHFILINEDNVEEDIDVILSTFSGGAWQVHEDASEQNAQNLTKRENEVPTENDFKKWKQNEDDFPIYIDGNPIKNTELNNYQPSDFVHYILGPVQQNAKSEKFPQPYQLHLYTKEEFSKIFLQDDRLLKILINKNGQLLVRSEIVELENLDSFLTKFNRHLSKEERQKSVRAIIVPDKSAPKEILATVEKLLDEYGVAQIDIRGLENSSTLPIQNGATQKQLLKYNALAQKYNAQPLKKRVIPLNDLKTLEGIYGRMTDTQKEDSEPFPECPPSPRPPVPPNTSKEKNNAVPPPPPPIVKPNKEEIQKIPPPPPPYKAPDPKKHSKALVKAFEEFDKKSNTYGKAIKSYKEKDEGTLAQLEQHYGEVMELYKAYVELAVKEGLMEPTPAKTDSKEKEKSIQIKEVEIEEAVENEREIAEIRVQKIIENQEIYDELSVDKKIIRNIIENQEIIEMVEIPVTPESALQTKEKLLKNNSPGEIIEVPPSPVHLLSEPQRPAQPKSPVDHISEMAKKDAMFYYEGKEINSDKAIEILQKKNEIDIETKMIKNQKPEVRLSNKSIKR